VPAAGRVEPLHALDVAPTALGLLGLPHDLEGRPVTSPTASLAVRG
jgi:arylsulfatase A-like enzyme